MTDHDSVEPPAALEARVVGTLRARGLLSAGAAVPGRAPARRLAWPVALAAGLLLFIGGFAMGRRPAASSVTGMSQYTLLLYEGPGFNAAGATEPELVKEYGDWAGELAGRGQLVSGEKLGDDAWNLGADRAGDQGPTGFFIIAARDQGEALAIARTCPHLRYGGTVSVRPIEPT